MKIKEVCEKINLTDRTIRYYMECGLLNPSNKETYSGRKRYEFSREDLERLEHIKVLRQAGFSTEQIKRFIDFKVTRNDIQMRLQQLQEEQQTAECLYDALKKADIARQISMDELVIILTNSDRSTITQPTEEIVPLHLILKKAKKTVQKLCILLVVALSCISILLYFLLGPNWMQNRNLNGSAVLTVRENDVLLSANTYVIGGIANKIKSENGYIFEAPYGDLRVNLLWKNTFVIECGFFNTNNWHHPYLLIDIEQKYDSITVTQTVTYKTDNNCIQSSSKTQTVLFEDGIADVYIGLD